jgi:hypothetical protein
VLKIQGRTYKHLIAQVNLIDDGLFLNWFCLLSTSKVKFVVFWNFYFSIFLNPKKNRTMLSLMLDPRFKILHQISSFIVYEVGVTIVEDYDLKFISYVF